MQMQACALCETVYGTTATEQYDGETYERMLPLAIKTNETSWQLLATTVALGEERKGGLPVSKNTGKKRFFSSSEHQFHALVSRPSMHEPASK